ncbi:MAG: carboxylate-amine ligase [Alphaproteobacteria bacterium]|nr:carboxylate-amine ligase [Alphaproteobacteria bacterium]
MQEPSFSFGIEEEYHLVDTKTRAFASAPETLMEGLEAELGKKVGPEFFQSQIEIGTKVCNTHDEARQDLRQLRQLIVTHTDRLGLAPIAASTHPFAQKSSLRTTEKDRYLTLARDLGVIGRRLAICGMHVHVGIEDEELRIDLMNQVRYFLPHLLMLSTSSPFWEGDETGLKSYRLAVLHELPRTGLPQRFESHGEYRRALEVLINAGVIEDATKIWWDLRPSERFPTLEMRISDVCTRMEDTLAIAALYRCLLRMLYRLRRNNQKWRSYPAFLLAENCWRAQRYGTSGTLFDFGEGNLIAFRNLVDELVNLVAVDAEVFGCEAEIKHLHTIAKEGTSADRQIQRHKELFDAGQNNDQALLGVTVLLIEETRSGLTV